MTRLTALMFGCVYVWWAAPAASKGVVHGATAGMVYVVSNSIIFNET